MATISEQEAAERIGHFMKTERKRRKITLQIMGGMVDISSAMVFKVENETYRTILSNVLRSLHGLGYTLTVVPLDEADRLPVHKGELTLDFDGVRPDTYGQTRGTARNQ